MKILITGGTTFVSKYAAEYFVSKDNDVTVINRGSRPQVNGVAHIIVNVFNILTLDDYLSKMHCIVGSGK